MGAVVILAFLNHHHGEPPAGQLIGRRGSTGTGANHHHIGLQLGVFIQVAGRANLGLPTERLNLFRHLYRWSIANPALGVVIQQPGRLEGSSQRPQQMATDQRAGQRR